MTDATFRKVVARTLDGLFDQLDCLDTDELDVRHNEGALHAAVEGQDPLILSQQVPLRELWLSANLRAWHFRFDGVRWLERESGENLNQVLSALFSARLGTEVRLG